MVPYPGMGINNIYGGGLYYKFFGWKRVCIIGCITKEKMGKGGEVIMAEGAIAMARDEVLENNFTYHAPKPGQAEKYTVLRDKAKDFAYWIKELTPASREQSVALTQLETAVFWANAAIARNE